MGDLKERLRRKDNWTQHKPYYHERNPDGPAAADRIEALERALREAENTLALVEHLPIADPDSVERVAALGREIGFGNLMATASAEWRKHGIVPGGEFVAGPCHVTVVKTLREIRQALGEGQ